MSRLFLIVLNMSIAAAVPVLAVLLIRIFFKRMPKNILCILWAAAALRLVIPFSAIQLIAQFSHTVGQPDEYYSVVLANEAPRSLPENSGNISEQSGIVLGTSVDETGNSQTDRENNGSPDIIDQSNDTQNSAVYYEQNADNTLSADGSTKTEKEPLLTFSAEQKAVSAISVLWLSGIAVLGIYAAFSYGRLHRRVRGSERIEGNVYLCSNINTPFILGIIRPKIYLPDNLTDHEREIILAHERAHIHRLDHLSKPVAFLLLAVHWFNPLVWAAYYCYCRDIESACDEKVLAIIGEGMKKTYASVLLQCSLPEKHSLTAPAAFGKTAIKERIRGILDYRRPSAPVMILCALMLISVTATACMMQSPVRLEENSTEISIDPGQAKELTEHERHLIELQNEMYEPPVSAGYKTENVTSWASGRVIYEVIDSLTELCYVNNDIEKQMQIYNETFLERKNDSPYRSIIDGLLFTSDKNFGDENDLKRYKVGLFTSKIDELIPKIKETHPHAAEKELIRLSIERKLQETAHRYELFGSWYGYLEGVLLGQIDVDSPRITLHQVLDIIDRSYQQNGDRSNYIYDQLCLLQKYPDVDFIGSGVYGSTIFLLAGQEESLELIKDYHGYSSIVFIKLYADGTRYRETLDKGTDNGYMYVPKDEPVELNYFTDEPASEESTAPSPVNPEKPSAEAVGLLKNTGNYADSIADTICSRYPSVTQEQMDEILILYDLAAPYDISYAYQVSIAAGKTDTSSPKLTLGDMKRIISEASGITDGAKDSSLTVKRGISDILKGIYDIQYYPDRISGDTYEYWPHSNSRKSRTEEIVVDVYAEKVIYNRYDTDGKLEYTEILYDNEEN